MGNDGAKLSKLKRKLNYPKVPKSLKEVFCGTELLFVLSCSSSDCVDVNTCNALHIHTSEIYVKHPKSHLWRLFRKKGRVYAINWKVDFFYWKG